MTTLLLITRNKPFRVLFFIAACLFCSNYVRAQTCLNWESIGLSTNNPVPNGAVYSAGGVSVKVNNFWETNGNVASNTFIYSGLQLGGQTGNLEAHMDNNTADVYDRYYVTFTFSKPVTGLNFTILDIDQDTYDDAVEVFYNGNNNIKSVSPAIYTLGSTVVADDEPNLDGFEGNGVSTGGSTTTSNVPINFGSIPVTSITIIYGGTDDPAGNPGIQIMGLSDLCWTGTALSSSNCFAWEDQGVANGTTITTGTAFTTSDLNTITTNYSLATDGGTVTTDVSFNSGPLGNHTGHLNIALDNDAFDIDDIFTLNLAFAKPVSGLKFTLLDIDRALNNWDDNLEVLINGVNIRDMPGTFTLGVAVRNVFTDNETYLYGFESASTADVTDETSNMYIDLGSLKVNTIQLRYRSGDDYTGDPMEQYIGISDLCWAQDRDQDGIADPVDIDDDNDGIPDTAESITGLDPLADPDGDNLPNYMDNGNAGFVDANTDNIDDRYDIDLDGIINSWDLDSDNDGIPDLVENGGVDTNGDGRIDVTTDADNDGLVSIYDTTEGGDALVNRDTDGDGVINVYDLDSDNDGIADIVDAGGTDSNNDGKADVTTDADSDGLVNAYDPDDNNDGTMEGAADARIVTGADTNGDGLANSYTLGDLDKDGKPNPYDLDADGDGILDVREAGLTDATNDGRADGTPGADGWSDDVDNLPSLALPDSDSDVHPDFLDIDADNDGITDNVEGQATLLYQLPSAADADNDGIDDTYDNDDAAFAGNVNNGITPVNSYGIDAADYLDTDTDDDGMLDRLEGHDYNLNNIADDDVALTGSDSDADGLDDKFDLDNSGANVTQEGMSAGGATTDPPGPGARGPLQKVNVGDSDRQWRNPLSVLPVTIVTFTATKQTGSGVLLKWEVENEVEFKEYVVERSSNGIDFSFAGTVRATGSQAYQFTDNPGIPAGGKWYYRLKLVDIDADYEYSRILFVTFADIVGLRMVATPNPASAQASVIISSEKKHDGTLRVFDQYGKLISVQRATVASGDNLVPLRDMQKWPGGLYTVQLYTEEQTISVKLMIRR